MSERKYYSPTSGEELKLESDGLLHASSGLVYTIDNNNDIIPLLSPIHGGQLYLDSDGLYSSDEDNIKYQISNGNITPLVGTISGDALIKENDGLFFSELEGTKYIVSENGSIKQMKDPFNGEILTPGKIDYREKQQIALESLQQESKYQNIKNMLNENIDLKYISEITGVTLEEIKNIQNELKFTFIETHPLSDLDLNNLQKEADNLEPISASKLEPAFGEEKLMTKEELVQLQREANNLELIPASKLEPAFGEEKLMTKKELVQLQREADSLEPISASKLEPAFGEEKLMTKEELVQLQRETDSLESISVDDNIVNEQFLQLRELQRQQDQLIRQQQLNISNINLNQLGNGMGM